MRRSAVGGLTIVALASALTGCEMLPPYPGWCSELDDWRSDVYPTAVAAAAEVSAEQRQDLLATLHAHADEIAEYPDLSAAFGALLDWWEDPPARDGLADRRALEEDVWDEFDTVHEACPGPFY